MSPVFSIGIAFKNPGRHFSLALQSVFAQTFPSWELILVDDGSTDGSVEFVKTLVDPRIRVYCDGERRNLNVRLNQMVKLAQGRFFVRMDADDVMHPERLQKQYDLLKRSDENTVVGSAAYSIDGESQVIGLRVVSSGQKSGFAARHSFDHPTVSASLEWFRRNPYSEQAIYHRAEDAELWCRTTQWSTFIVLRDPLLFYREGDALSYAGFLSTKIGLLFLLKEKYPRPLLRYLYLSTIEAIQLWIGCLCDGVGKARWILAQRYRPLDEASRQKASAVLEQIKLQALPISLLSSERHEPFYGTSTQ
jgi:glycosyltransferase involved in cell wall biosynthesis